MTLECPKCRHKNPDNTRFCGLCGVSLKPVGSGDLSETLEAPREDLRAGSIFAGRYQIIEELGKGGMGRVYKALDEEINLKLALKLIKPEISSNTQAIERLRNELKIARSINHKNVCRLYDINKEAGVYFITMEYVDGLDLKGLIRQTGQLALPSAISIAKQVCEGLAEAHALGVVHRDLKPANIMIDKDGSAHIMDFGIAFSLRTKGTTVEGIMTGTPEYMSPEQAQAREVDQRSDIYSLGIVLFEMATGEVPFKADDLLSIALKHKSEMPKEPQAINPQIPDELNHLILKCLAKDKEKRYQTASELLTDLTNLETGSPRKDKPDDREWKHSIAVLPFADLSPQKDQEYFCDGIVEELINHLSQIKGLRVVARTSAFYFKDKNIDVREAGRILGADRILEGSVKKAGNRIRISIQLIDALKGYQLWTDRFDRDLEDVFAIQDEVTLAVIEKYKIKLLNEEKEQILKRRLENPEHYNLYLKGKYFLNMRTEAGFRKSLSYFQKIVKRKPTSSLGYAGLADAYHSLGYFNLIPADEAYSRAKEAAEKALALDATLAEARVSLAGVKLFYDWNIIEAEKELREAIKHNPGYISAHHRLAFCLSASGRHEEAIDEIKQAQALDPLSPMINTAAAWVFYVARKYDSAVELCKRIHEIDPNFHVAYVVRGLALMEKDHLDDAISLFHNSLELEKSDIAPLGYLSIAYAKADKKHESLKINKKIENLSKQRYVAPIYRAVTFLGLGQNDLALEWMKKGFQERNPWLIFLQVWPIFDNLKPYSEYKILVDKLKCK